MTKYLSYTFEDNEETANTCDELPFWSAPFGLLLFKYLELKPNLTIVDIGSGGGFPLLELAERVGESCQFFGIDTWKNANKRAEEKIRSYNISNVKIIEASAENMPFDDSSIDLIISNLGINNFDNPEKVFEECNRVLKTEGNLVITTNMNGHWKEFYDVFEKTLEETNQQQLIEKLNIHQEKRGNIESITKLFTDRGFKISKCYEETFEMKFLNGTAFFNHHFIKLGWLDSWKTIVPEERLYETFSKLENNLNLLSEKYGGLTLSVPMAFFEGKKKKN